MIDLYLALLLAVTGVYPSQTTGGITLQDQALLTHALVYGERSSSWRIFRTLPPVTPEPYRRPGRISARAGVVRDVASGSVLWSRDLRTAYPIASLTKLMTAIVVLESGVDFDEEVEITPEDFIPPIGNTLVLSPGERVRRQDLLLASLVGSMNNATQILARSTGLTFEEFVMEMNTTARRFGMAHTTFADVTGLDPANMSSADDLSRLVERVFEYVRIRDAVLREFAPIEILPRRRTQTVRSTNELLKSGKITFHGAKTGYLDEAGYTYSAVVEHDEQQLSIVLLDASSSAQRFSDALSLAEWAFASHRWPDVQGYIFQLDSTSSAK